MVLEYGGYEVILVQEADSSWMLTGYRLGKRKKTDETEEVQRFIQSYASESYNFMRPQTVAGSASNIQNSSKNNEKGHANTERDTKKNGRRRGRKQAGHALNH